MQIISATINRCCARTYPRCLPASYQENVSDQCVQQKFLKRDRTLLLSLIPENLVAILVIKHMGNVAEHFAIGAFWASKRETNFIV